MNNLICDIYGHSHFGIPSDGVERMNIPRPCKRCGKPYELICIHDFIKTNDLDVVGSNAPWDSQDVGNCRKCGAKQQENDECT